MVAVSPLNGINFVTRDSVTRLTLGPSTAAPVWLKVVKSGNTISGFASSTGYSNWIPIGSTSIAMPETFYLGFAVASHADPMLSTAQFSNSVFMRDVPQRSADMLLWLRADSGVTATGSSVGGWEDQSGRGNNAAQSAQNNQPLIETGALNGLPVLDFAKVSTFNKWLQVPSGFNDFDQGVSIFAVAKAPTAVSDSRIMDFGNNTSSNNAQLYQSTTNGITFRAYNGTNGKAVTNTGNMSTSAYRLASVVHDGNYKATIFINGTETSASGSANMNNFVDIIRTGNFVGKGFGATNHWEGKLAELIVFKRALAPDEVRAMQSYFHYKYGSTVSGAAKPAPPTMNLASGVYSTSQSLIMTAPPLTNEIRYTTNGSDPTTGSTLYTGAINVTNSTLFKAITVAGGQTSTVKAVTIDIDANSADVSRLGLNLWLKANIGTDIKDGGVKTWYDLSGSSFDATQDTIASRPTVTTETVGAGTKSVLAFNGTSQWLQLPKGLSTGFSTFVIAKPTAGGGARIFDLSDQDASNIQLMTQGAATPDLRYRVFNPTQTTLDADDAVSFSVHKLYEVIQNGSGANASIYVNGGTPVSSSTMNPIPAVARSSNFIGKQFGANDYFAGRIAEILIYNRAVDNSERLGIEAYAFSKYGSPVSMKPSLPAPEISPPSTTVSGPLPYIVRITATNNAQIRYTTDGSTPTSSSPLYPPQTNPPGIPINVTTTVKAIAVKSNFNDSSVATSTIVVDPESTGIVNENLQLWLNGENLTGADESAITRWDDSSGNNNHAEQATGANQPLVERPAQNNLPAAKFDGSNDWMQFPSGFADFTQGLTIFAVAKPTSASPNSGRLLDWGNAASSDNIQFFLQNNPDFRMSILNGATATNATGNGVTNNAFQLLEARHNGAGLVTLFVNGVQTGSSTSMNNINNITRNGNFLGKAFGNTNYFPGQIAELLVYNKLLSLSTIQTIQNYLLGKYALVQTATPIISPSTGVFGSQTQITITSPTPGATIYYSDTGSTNPTTPYTGPFNISTSSTITSKAILNGSTSALASSYIQIDSATKALPRGSMVLWLKADNGINPLSPDLALWPDVSGAANNATQPTGSKKPTYVYNAVGDLPAVDFSGSDQWLQLPSGMADFSQGLSAFIVTKPGTSPPLNARIFDLGTGTSANNIILSLPSSSSSQFWTSGSSSDSITASSSLSTGEYRLLEVTHTGRDAGAIYSNAQQKVLALLDNPTQVMRTANFIGKPNSGTEYYKGRIAEIMLYNKLLTASERQNVEAYLVGRYGLGSGLVIPPTIKPASGVYTAEQEVTISAYPGATIKYTTDGTTPNASSPTYTTSFKLAKSATVKAIAGNSTVTTNYIDISPGANSVPRDGLNLWYKGDFGVESAAGVSLWVDLSGSGNNNDATQSDAQKRPVITDSFGFPLVHTQYKSGDVVKPAYFDIPAGLSDFSSGLTFYTTSIPLSSTSVESEIFNASNGLADNNIEVKYPTANQKLRGRIRPGTGASQLVQTSNDEVPLNRLQLMEYAQDGANRAKIYINSVEKANSAQDNARDATRLTNKFAANADASGDEFYTGDTGEVLLYNRALNPSERTAVESYLTNRFQLLTSFPLASPVLSPSGGSFAGPIQVAITGPVNSTIYFTTDGTNPVPSEVNRYRQPISVTYTQTVNAIATYQGQTSSVASQTFTLDAGLWPPPNSLDTTPLDLQLQSPTGAILH
jgi:hypothetical protein